MIERARQWLESERAIYMLVALFVLLGSIYAVTTPIFEAGDELWHYPHVQWIARGNGLPVQDPSQEQLWEQEGGQPPLYYVTGAALTFWIDTGDMQERLWRNPYARIGVPLAFGNKNMVVHTAAEELPWSGTTLAVHLIRLLSVLFSAGTVLFTYRIAREISQNCAPALPASLSLLAASVVAFNPMFLFISASVNNDSLAALLATVALYASVRLVTRGMTDRRVFSLGVLVGLAVLAKVSNLALGLVVGTVILYCTWRQLRTGPGFPYLTFFSRLVRAGVILLVPVALITGWWFARNYILYGDPLAFNVWLKIAGGRPPQTLFGLLDEFQGFRISFWGNFGGVNIIAPDWVYRALDAFTLLAVVGLVIGSLRRALPALLWIPVLHLVVVFVALVRWTLMTYASQGRLMFPAIAAAAILLTFGLYQLADGGWRMADGRWRTADDTWKIAIPALLPLFLFGFAICAPFALIVPAYAAPPRVADESRVANPVHIKFDAGGAQPELVGFDAPRFVQGDELPLKLYWRTDAPVAEDLAMYVHVYDVNGEPLGQWDAYPGNGLYPPRLWRAGEIIADEYRVPVKYPDAYPPVGRIEVGMTRVGASNVLPARNPQGDVITPSLARFKFSRPAGAPAAPRLTFGDSFNGLSIGASAKRGAQPVAFDTDAGQSISLKPGDTFTLKVILQARQVLDTDYTLFAHVVDSNGVILAQRDAQPLDNAYPTTLWDANEQVTDALQMQIPANAPAGDYTLEFGIYRAGDLQRLPLNGNEWGIWRVQGDHLSAPLQIAP